jgi:Peptidase family M23
MNSTSSRCQRPSLRGPLLAGVAALLLVAPGAVDAAGPRPLFQMPVPCGQKWEASTYEGHWNGDQDAIDLAQREDDGTNISEGEPALASADGTVADAYTSNGEHRVLLDHGGGWTTHYVHLESVPPLADGQFVAAGEQIGRISNSGAESMHLHYNQEADGEPVAVKFNGQAIQTNAENEETWGTYGDGEELTSLNCPGNSFMQFNQDGRRHQLEYKPGSGQVSIDRFKADGAGLEHRWSGEWSQGWTHFVPFSHDDEARFFVYKSSSGKVSFNKVNADGQGNQTLSQGTWGKGWTHFMPFSKSGSNYYIAYSSLYGGANLDRITAAGTGGATIWQGNWGKGWTHLAPFDLDGVQYFLAYHGGTGAVEIDKVTGSGNSLSINEDWASTWSKGWTHIVPIGHNGDVHLLLYKAGSGKATYAKVKAGGEGVETLGSESWSKPWTAFSPFTLDGKGHFIAYKAGSGQVVVDRLSASGADSSGIWSDLWTLGWT